MRLNVLDSEITKRVWRYHPFYHYAILRNYNILVEMLQVNYKT
jgi:hypothetical protein